VCFYSAGSEGTKEALAKKSCNFVIIGISHG
jgi:hypothetical protein